MPRFSLNVADRRSGAESTIQVDAETASDAEQLVSGQGYFVSKVELAPHESAPVALEYRSPNDRPIAPPAPPAQPSPRPLRLTTGERLACSTAQFFAVIFWIAGISIAMYGCMEWKHSFPESDEKNAIGHIANGTEATQHANEMIAGGVFCACALLCQLVRHAILLAARIRLHGS